MFVLYKKKCHLCSDIGKEETNISFKHMEFRPIQTSVNFRPIQISDKKINAT